MVFAAQYAGLFSNKPNGSSLTAVVPQPAPIPLDPTPRDLVAPAPTSGVVAAGRQYSGSYITPRVRRGGVLVGGAVPAGYMTAEDGGVVLVRGRNGDMDVQMPTVSVGAQPLLYVSAGQRAVRNVGTSF